MLVGEIEEAIMKLGYINEALQIAQAIATAIESGAVIRLKETK